MSLNFGFSVDYYDETVNVRHFSGDAMFGSIGGYIGMILGISFLQLPGIVYYGFEFLKSWNIRQDKISKINSAEY